MVISLLFILLIISSSLCFLFLVRAKRKNIGAIITILVIIAGDVFCYLLLECRNIVRARDYLAGIYICQAWTFFGIAWMVGIIARKKRYIIYMIPILFLSIVQTVIMAANYFNIRSILVTKHLFAGGAWWIAKSPESTQPFFTLIAYNLCSIISTILLFFIIIYSLTHSARLYRMRLFAFFFIHIALFVINSTSAVFNLPMWIPFFVMNVVCVYGLYYIYFYSDRKLQRWSLTNFANEMSDGFILYNEFDEPIHINDLLKNTLPSELIQSFEDKSVLDEWLEETIVVENIEVKKCEVDNTQIYFKVKKTDLNENDNHLGTVYILHDTTESILKMHAMEEANYELERAARMKSDFLANMSHEIRTPMNAVIGMAEITMREELPPQVKDNIRQIQSAGRNLLNIINDILDFSKIEAGKMDIVPERYEPLSEINDVANILSMKIGDKDIELFVICDTGIPHALSGDVMRIRQVLLNIAGNAIKFTQKGQVVIDITCENYTEDEVTLTFHVTDTGRGIKEEDIDKLFESFSQLDSKRNRSVEGTGLGLAISQKLCEAMNGTIGVKSEFGKGSDFYFSIPQKIVDPSRDLIVEMASFKHAFVINDDANMVDQFMKEMTRLNVEGKAISSIHEYEPTGDHDFILFEEKDFNEEMHFFLKNHEDVTGVVLVDFDSTYIPEYDNLRVMRRPETTLSMVMILNGHEVRHESVEGDEAYKIDFIAPDAKILVVDDNAINITIAEGLMKPIRVNCIGALSGREAVEKVQSEDFDIIFMDHMMPEMDGVETTRLIRSSIPKAADIPIIALTANALEGAREMFLDEGMNDFVAKPVEIRTLAAKIRQWLPDSKVIRGDKIDEMAALETADDSSEEALAKFKGLDYTKAIAALGSVDLYEKIVKEYYRAGQDKYNEIKSALDNEDWDKYTINVHALKSSSRQIGAMTLGDMAERLEKAGNDRDLEIVYGYTAETLETFDELLNKLSLNFKEEDTGADQLPEIDREEFDRIMGVLSEACDNLDMDEMEGCRNELKKYSYSDEAGSILNEIYNAIDDIDVDKCMELMSEVRKMI